jgi:hypothetical protein
VIHRDLWPVCRRAVTGVVAAVLAATAILAVACGGPDDRRPVTLAPADMRLVATSLPATTLVGPPGVAVGLLDRSHLDATQRASRSAAAPRPQPALRARAATRTTRSLPLASSGDGTDALLWRIALCESHGQWTAHNPTSSASGAWQVLTGTWAHYGGYPTAAAAPAAVQWAHARALYNRAGTRPWAASRRCWS